MLKSQGDEGTLLPKDIQKALKTALNMCKVDAGICLCYQTCWNKNQNVKEFSNLGFVLQMMQMINLI